MQYTWSFYNKCDQIIKILYAKRYHLQSRIKPLKLNTFNSLWLTMHVDYYSKQDVCIIKHYILTYLHWSESSVDSLFQVLTIQYNLNIMGICEMKVTAMSSYYPIIKRGYCWLSMVKDFFLQVIQLDTCVSLTLRHQNFYLTIAHRRTHLLINVRRVTK